MNSEASVSPWANRTCPASSVCRIMCSARCRRASGGRPSNSRNGQQIPPTRCDPAPRGVRRHGGIAGPELGRPELPQHLPQQVALGGSEQIAVRHREGDVVVMRAPAEPRERHERRGHGWICGQSRIARWISSITVSGATAASHGTETASLRRGDGTLRLMIRDFATTLFGMVAMSLPAVRICTERQLICTTSPSTGPSRQTWSPIA